MLLLHFKKFKTIFFSFFVILTICTACSTNPPAQKPDMGPIGKTTEATPNLPLNERMSSPPIHLYDMELISERVFESIMSENWYEGRQAVVDLQERWKETIPFIGKTESAKGLEKSLTELKKAIKEEKKADAYEALNKTSGSLGDIAKLYKLSPLSDIIGVSSNIRNVTYYVETQQWKPAASKAKELESNWKQAKPSLEQAGILGEVTKTHSSISQLKDAVETESIGAYKNHIKTINSSLNKIQLFYYGK